MKKSIPFAVAALFFLITASLISGCATTRAITVEYLPGAEETDWLKELLSQDSPNYQPTIAVNHLRDERAADETVGAIYSRSGKQVETLISYEKPVDLLEKALIRRLERAGFKVVATSGWNLNPDTIPGYLDTDFILGGCLKAFWVEAKAGLISSAVESSVAYNLIIADARRKKIIWSGRLTGYDRRESLAHTNDFFWTDLQDSLNKSLTRAVNQFFQDEQAKKAVVTLIRVKF